MALVFGLMKATYLILSPPPSLFLSLSLLLSALSLPPFSPLSLPQTLSALLAHAHVRMHVNDLVLTLFKTPQDTLSLFSRVCI